MQDFDQLNEKSAEKIRKAVQQMIAEQEIYASLDISQDEGDRALELAKDSIYEDQIQLMDFVQERGLHKSLVRWLLVTKGFLAKSRELFGA